jgi:hypothetical protein
MSSLGGFQRQPLACQPHHTLRLDILVSHYSYERQPRCNANATEAVSVWSYDSSYSPARRAEPLGFSMDRPFCFSPPDAGMEGYPGSCPIRGADLATVKEGQGMYPVQALSGLAESHEFNGQYLEYVHVSVRQRRIIAALKPNMHSFECRSAYGAWALRLKTRTEHGRCRSSHREAGLKIS